MLSEKVLTIPKLLLLQPSGELFEHCFLWQHKKDGIYIIWMLKQPFLNGDLKEGVYMLQPQGFVIKGKE